MTTALPPPIAQPPLRVGLSFPLPSTVRLAVAGEVDLVTAPMLRTGLLLAMDAHHPAVLDVDLAEVSFLDCSGVGALVSVRNTAERSGCQILVSRPPPRIAQVLELAGLLGLLTAPVSPAEPTPTETRWPPTGPELGAPRGQCWPPSASEIPGSRMVDGAIPADNEVSAGSCPS